MLAVWIVNKAESKTETLFYPSLGGFEPNTISPLFLAIVLGLG